MGTRLLICTVVFLLADIVLQAQVNVDFRASEVEGCGTLQAEFTDLSASTSGQIVEWQWELGESVMSSLQNPGRIFSEPGSYDICLTVIDANGNTGKQCKQHYISVHEIPQVAFAADIISGCAPLATTFRNLTISTDPITDLVWDLGGDLGVVMGGVELDTISAEYTKPDNYTVSLIATTDKGCNSVAVRESYVQVGGIERPSVAAVEAFSCTGPHDTKLLVSGLSDGVVYSWGVRDSALTLLDTAKEFSFSSQGLFDIIVTANDTTTGCFDTFTFHDVVQIGNSSKPKVNTPLSCTDYAFSFVDSLLDKPDSVVWDFGDGDISTSISPKHKYELPGCYDVSLTIFKDGCATTSHIDTCVEVRERPDIVIDHSGLAKCSLPAQFDLSTISPQLTNVRWVFPSSSDTVLGQSIGFEADSLVGTIPFEVSGTYISGCRLFLNDSLYAGQLDADLRDVPVLGCVPTAGTPIVEINADFEISDWEWEVTGMDTTLTATGEQPTFEFIEAGTYNISVAIASAAGCTDTVESSNYFKAGRRPDLSFEADNLFTCSDSTIYFEPLSTMPLDEFFWSFGDGGTSTQPSPGYVYSDTGSFTVVLQAGYNGCFSIDSITDYIEILGPVSLFKIDFDCELNRLRLEDRSVAADNIRWEITNEGGAFFSASSDSIVEIDLPTHGYFEIVHYSENSTTGCTDLHRDTVDLRPPQLEVEFVPNAGCAPLEVTVENINTEFTSWHWSIPGGRTKADTVKNPEVVFNRPGVYNDIEVEVLDRNGCIQIIDIDQRITVGGIRPQLGLPLIVCRDSPFELTTSVQPEIPVSEWSWVVSPGPYLFDEALPVTSLSDTGYYSVELNIVDSIGCPASTEVDSFIQVLSGNTAWSGDTIGCVDQTFTFSIQNPEMNVIYTWDFGDAIVDTGNTVNHVFSEQGSFEVCVTTANLFDCSSTTCQLVRVTEVVADFASDIQFANCPPLLVSFDNHSINGIEYTWSFGDESGRSIQYEPAHVYANAGSYDVQLITSIRGNCADTITKSDFIIVDGPKGEFSLEADDGCAPVEAKLKGVSNDIYQYVWDLDNGILDSSTIRTLADTAYVTYTSTGDFVPRLTLIDDDNCRITLQSEDTVFVREDFLDAGGDRTICLDESILIAPEVSSGTVYWLPHPIIEDTTEILLDIMPDSNSTLVIIGIDKACTVYDTVNIEVLEKAHVTGGALTACRGDTITLTAAGEFDHVEWFDSEWNLIQDSSSTQVAIADSQSEFNIVASLSTCLDDTSQYYITIPDDILYSLPNRVTVYPSEAYSVPLKLNSDNINSIAWTPEGQLDCYTCVNPIITIDTTTTLKVFLSEAEGNCSVEDSIVLFVPSACNKKDIFIPNVFTPNGDGNNDVITMETEKISSLLGFDVFDRWGTNVFSSTRTDFQWNGLLGGSELPAGVYTYSLNAICPIDGTPFRKSGDITLLR